MIVTANLFDTLGVKTERGRTFRLEDVDALPVAVIGHDLWQSRFHAAPEILGQQAVLGSKRYQIIGVMPRNVGLRMINQETDAPFYALIQKDEPAYSAGGTGPIAAIGRLKPGIDMRGRTGGTGRHSTLLGPAPSRQSQRLYSFGLQSANRQHA